MLCRHLKSLRSHHQELSKDVWVEGMAIALEAKGLSRGICPSSLIVELFNGVKHWPTSLETIQVVLALIAFCTGALVQAENLKALQTASLIKEAEAQKISTPALSAATQLQGEAKNWLAQQLRLSAEQIQIDEMDARLKVQPCSVGVSFDHPFANRQVIRARCEKPSWQYFLKANLSDEQSNKLSNKSSPPNGTTSAQANSVNLANSANPNWASSSKVPPSPMGVLNAPSALGTKIKMVLVANQPLRRGTILQPSFFKLVEMSIPSTDNMVLSQYKEIENTELLHDMGAEQALRNYDIKPTLLVKRGQQVNFSIGEGRGFLITIKTEAQQDGSLGDQIKLKNVESGRLISGVITGLNEARAL